MSQSQWKTKAGATGWMQQKEELTREEPATKSHSQYLLLDSTARLLSATYLPVAWPPAGPFLTPPSLVLTSWPLHLRLNSPLPSGYAHSLFLLHPDPPTSTSTADYTTMESIPLKIKRTSSQSTPCFLNRYKWSPPGHSGEGYKLS